MREPLEPVLSNTRVAEVWPDQIATAPATTDVGRQYLPYLLADKDGNWFLRLVSKAMNYLRCNFRGLQIIDLHT